MIWTNIKRISRTGFISVFRNPLVSLSSVVIMTIALLVISAVVFSNSLLVSALTTLQDRVDVNVYFLPNAQESEVKAIKTQIEIMEEVASVEYLSQEEVLVQFKQRHQNDQYTVGMFEEFGFNPLGATLNIHAKDPAFYGQIVDKLEQQIEANGDSNIISKINYQNNKAAIDNLTNIITISKQTGIISAIIFILISVLITFNTVHLAIFTSKDEISVMQLVGAKRNYVRGPFIISGVVYGILAAIIALIIVAITAYGLNTYTANFFSGVGVWTYFLNNILFFLGLIFGSGILIGIVSSFIAVRKYLSV